MKTLEDAWQWYLDAQKALHLIHRLGEKHWAKLPWNDANFSLANDDAYRMLESQDITQPAKYALTHLKDLAIVVMFSVFEAIVREDIVEQIEPESATLRHQSLKEAAEEVIEKISLGSFYRVLAPFRALEPELTEEVDQVRNYRNWVAHGKRKAFKNAVTPEVAHDRLARFLDKFIARNSMNEEEWLAMFRETGE
jgi:hypothetical protein